MEDGRRRLRRVGAGLAEAGAMVEHFAAGCLDVVRHVRVGEEARGVQVRGRQNEWLVALAELHDKAWVSMQETHIKNKTLIEEWQESKVAIAEGIATALERLDVIEEGTLKEQARVVDERLRQTSADNAALAQLIEEAQAAFAPVRNALWAGDLGVALSPDEKLRHAVPLDQWAYRLVSIYVYRYVYIYIYIYTHARTHTHTHTHTHIHIYIHMNIYIYIYIYR